jgi:sugar/nucleoside kinase (ribokinase family)
MNTRETMYTDLGVNADWEPALPPGWEDSETAFLAAGDPGVQLRLIQSLRAPRATMVDTIKLFLDVARDELKATIAAADFISINDSEARELTGTPSVANAGRRLLTSGPRGVLVKLGEYGAVFASEHDYFVAPGYPLEQVVDPTGAGDAFAGAFLGYLDSVGEFKPGDLRRATVYASTVASFQVEGYGPERLLTLTRDEVDARYREFRTLTIFEAGD